MATQQNNPPKRISLFITCLIDQLYPGVGESVVNVLERLGIEVDFLEEQTCCGQPAFNTGYVTEARRVAERFIEIFERTEDPIVVPSGSCGAMVRNLYPEVFADDPEMLARAKRVGERVYEFSEFLVDVLGVRDLDGVLDGTATYHQCCHLLRELGVDSQPRRLLEGIEGLELREMDKSEVCCGFGGTFAVKFSEISTAMLDEKLEAAKATGAEWLVAGDAGCLMHMQGGMRRRGERFGTIHLAQLLDQATAARRPSTGRGPRLTEPPDGSASRRARS